MTIVSEFTILGTLLNIYKLFANRLLLSASNTSLLKAVTDLYLQLLEGKVLVMSDLAVADIDIVVMRKDDSSIPEGWQLLEDESIEEPDGPVTLEVVAVLEGDESCVGGEELLEREKKVGKRAGLRAAKALLRKQRLIPAEWRYRKYLVFTGTVVRSLVGDRLVAVLCWGGYGWFLYYTPLSVFFGSEYPAVRCSRKQ